MGNDSSKSQSNSEAQPSVFVSKTLHPQKLIKIGTKIVENKNVKSRIKAPLCRKKRQMLFHLCGCRDNSSVGMNKILDS